MLYLGFLRLLGLFSKFQSLLLRVPWWIVERIFSVMNVCFSALYFVFTYYHTYKNKTASKSVSRSRRRRSRHRKQDKQT